MPIWYAPVVVPKRANTYLAGSRTYPSTSPTGDTRCRCNRIHQSHRIQSQGPPSCPTSQLMYWQPKGLPAPPITPAAGHPRIANTWELVRQHYEGPRLRQFVEEYVKGCPRCQETKTNVYRHKVPLQRLDTVVDQGPFQFVSMD